MEQKHSLIATEEGRIIHMGEAMLSYIDLSRERPIAYPAGAIEKDDVVLFISRNLSCGEEHCFKKIGVNVSRQERCVLFLGAYENSEIQPIEKYGNDLFPEEKTVLLDTFFLGRDIKVEWKGRESLLNISINGQWVECSLAEYDDQLLILREGGLRYFRDNAAESRRDSNAAVLSGKMFYCYQKAGVFSQVPIEEVFQEGLWDHLESMNAPERKVFIYKEKAISLRCSRWDLRDDTFFEYTILARADLLNHMGEESALYHALGQTQEKRLRASLIPTTFRLWGNDSNLSRVKLLLQKACDTNVTVLLTGESGTGKTFLAREIHKNSKRYHKNFVHVNCAAIPYQLIESELFGYEDGAFTGAKRGGKKGYFESAEGGTIFLDEITEMPLSLQGKLLEVMQSKTFYRVGGTEKISVNVRLIAATNRDLKEQVSVREFREDLYYRINVFPIELPPLRDRREAIHAIVADILPGICEKVELEPLLISPQALQKMRGYSWPGNIRELENLLEKAVILSDGKIILPEDVMIPETQEAVERAVTLREHKERCEKQAIVAALTMYNGDKGQAARYLDIGRTNLFEKIRKYGIRDRWIGGQDDIE